MNEDDIKKKLTPEEYRVLRQKGTEAPFSGTLLHDDRTGTYTCKVCSTPLFASEAKFESDIESLKGWPSFDQALPGATKEVADMSHGMIRTEVVCATCGSHLGHIFEDSSAKTGKHYCLNSVCLDLKEDEA